MVDYAKELGAAMGGKGAAPMSEPADASGDYSPAKDAAARALATALGIDPEQIDTEAVCDAVKNLVELEE